MVAKEYLEHIGNLIGQDKLREAIDSLMKLLKNSRKLDEVIIASARYTDIMKQIRLGITDLESADITKNKIRFALLDMLREIEDELENNPETEKELQDYLSKQPSVNTNTINISGSNSTNVNVQNSDVSGTINIDID